MELEESVSSGLSRFAIPADAEAPALSRSLVDAFDAAVAQEHFDSEDAGEE